MFDDFFSSMDEIGRPSVQQGDWMKSCRMEMVTVDTIAAVVDACIASGLYALDLECTGLDNRVLPGTDCTVDKITGICLSPDDNTGYYIPVRHPKHLELCIPISIVAREMKRLIEATENKTTRVVFHNGKFDQEFLQFCGWGVTLGEWDDPKCWDDTMLLAYLSNTRIRNKGLKHLASEHLGVKMIRLQELFTREEEATSGKDFGVLDPSWPPTLWYACSDAICTRRLYAKLRGPALDPTPEGLPSQQLIYEMEKLCVAATRWMERNRVPINRERVKELIILGQREWIVALGEVYKEASAVLGRDITPGYYRILTDPSSPLRYDPERVTAITPAIKAAQAEAFRRKLDLNDLGQIPTYPKNVIKLTPKSEFKPKGPPPKKGFEEVQFPAVYDVTVAHELGLLFREIGIEGLVATEKSGQAKTSKDELNRVIESAGEDMVFVKKIKKFREVAKTLASNLMPLYLYSSADPDPETGFVFSPDSRVKVNFEAFKTDTARFATPAKEADEDDAGGENFNGTIPWNLHSIPSGAKKGIPECAQRMREVIEVGPDSILVAIDFSGEELRVVTNVSGEPLWVTEFFRCSSCDHRFEIGTRPPPFCPKCKSDKIGDIHTLTAIAINGPDIVNDAKLFKEKRGEGKCVHPDTLIRTSNGLMQIGSLPTGEVDAFADVSNVQVAGPNQTFVRVASTYNGGLKNLYHVLTRRGVLTCSAEHRFLMSDGTLRSIATGLTEGDSLSEPEQFEDDVREYPELTYRPFTGVPIVKVRTDDATAYVAGLHAGDGACSTTSANIVHGQIGKTDLLGTAYTVWQSIIVQACLDAGLSPNPRSKNVYLGSRHVKRWMETLGMVQGSRRTFRVPSWIWQAGREAIRHYLGGLVDTDGHVTKGGDISVVTKDMVFAGQIVEAFRAAGCRPSVAPSYNRTYDRWYAKISIKRCEGRILRPYMRHPGKIARISETTSALSAWGNDVLKIIPAGEHACVDIHVESEDHLYVSNGLTTHNSVNFGLCYGGGGQAVVAATGCSKEEGWRVKKVFDKTYIHLFKWWDQVRAFGRQTGHVLTSFNRRYPVPDINSEDGFFRSKAERNAVNGPIQATGADIMKLAMGLIYREMKKRGWLRKVRMIITIHDELVFDIDRDVFSDAIEIIVDCMINRTTSKLNWLVPLTVDIECGRNWKVPYNLTHMAYGMAETPADLQAPVAKWRSILKLDAVPVGATVEAPAPAPVVVPADNTPVQVEQPVVVETPIVPVERVQRVSVEPAPAMPEVKRGDLFIHRINSAIMTMKTATRLSRVIVECSGRGTNPLRVEDEAGNLIFEDQKIMVNPMEFTVLMNRRGSD